MKKAKLIKTKAIADIQKVFKALAGSKKTATPAPSKSALRKLTCGKLYELYCLAQLLAELRTIYGFRPHFQGTSFVFKGSPGAIHPGDSKFVFSGASGNVYAVFTDIEFTTLGATVSTGGDNSDLHEIDIVVVEAGVTGNPRYDQILLGVECKAHAYFQKHILKQALGIRREMGYFHPHVPSLLSQDAITTFSRNAKCDAGSEYWLAFLHSHGMNYKNSPDHFGIEFRHWQP